MGYSDKAKKYKVSEWFDEWMKLYKIGRIKTNTVRGYVDGFERATDFIGSVRLCIGEISALLWSDIDFEKHRIRVCKTLNETTVFYDDSKNRLEETYSKKQIATPNREPHLFSVHPHKFRHTFVTRMNQSGMSPFTVRKIVGHAHVNMTEYYTHLEQEYISDEFNKFSEKYEEEKVPAIPEKNNKGKLWKITLIIQKIPKGGQKVVKTVWKMPQTRIKQGLPQILLRCHPYGNGDLFRY